MVHHEHEQCPHADMESQQLCQRCNDWCHTCKAGILEGERVATVDGRLSEIRPRSCSGCASVGAECKHHGLSQQEVAELRESLKAAVPELKARLREIDGMKIRDPSVDDLVFGTRPPLSPAFLARLDEDLARINLGDNPTSREAEAMEMRHCDPAERQCRIGKK